MTRTSIQDYARVVRERYLLADRAEKAALLDEFCRNTGYHRKAAIRLLRHPPRPRKGRRGRRPRYGAEVSQALCRLWESTDRMCGKRLAPFLPELVAHLELLGELRLPPEVRAQVVQLSAATVDRLLQPWRTQPLRRPWTQGRAASALKALVPLRTFGDCRVCCLGPAKPIW